MYKLSGSNNSQVRFQFETAAVAPPSPSSPPTTLEVVALIDHCCDTNVKNVLNGHEVVADDWLSTNSRMFEAVIKSIEAKDPGTLFPSMFQAQEAERNKKEEEREKRAEERDEKARKREEKAEAREKKAENREKTAGIREKKLSDNMASMKADIATLTKNQDRLAQDVTEIKTDQKKLMQDVSDLKTHQERTNNILSGFATSLQEHPVPPGPA
ncbi:hypothetical protein Pst134EA_008958 [Puccinia striiformis f. sp. tritici]|uniref:hypothetical protein n=1 Tax=Puccinia striiformis f. sp. tritici TaxID=168172 RepID=UPI002007424C|nr:hypothetical protein Pst134EA_008958 [Puccinia striiformis f. sp. tritici]KAH9468418.1 hypothetical protein Pst134EA_008958 [Puccinia striiformis f. sp. tritici]